MKDRIRQHIEYKSKDERAQHEERQGGADDRLLAGGVMAADGMAQADSRAHGQADDHDGGQVDDLAADGDGACGGGSFELTDDEEVGQTVERLQETGDQVGDGEHQKVLPDRTGGQVTTHAGKYRVLKKRRQGRPGDHTGGMFY